jgi:hypothetical protein
MRSLLSMVMLSALSAVAVQSAHGQTETVLHFFCAEPNCTDGASPEFVTPVLDKQENFYGTTAVGGAYGYGTFAASPIESVGLECESCRREY